MTHSAIADYLDNVIYPKLDRMRVFEDLNPKQKGEVINCDCPKCGKEGKAYIFASKFKLHCWSCSASVHILAYVAKTEAQPRGEQFLRALTKLAGLAGVPPPDQVLAPEVFSTLKREAQKADTFQKIFEHCRNTLSDPWEAEDARRFLEYRGFRVELHALGWLDKAAACRQFASDEWLLDVGFASLREDGSLYFGSWDRRVIGPLCSRDGRILGFFGRIIDDERKSPKYLWTKGAAVATSGAFGLAEAPSGSLILVEGVLDVYKARQFGIANLAAFGGTGSSNRWTVLTKEYACREATLCFDNDKAGRKATMTALASAFKTAKDLTLYVVPPEALGDCKDPDEYISKYGGEAFLGLVEARRVPAAGYYARELFNGSSA